MIPENTPIPTGTITEFDTAWDLLQYMAGMAALGRPALARYLGQQVQARRDEERAAAGLPAYWTTAEWETVLTRVLNRVDWRALAETIIRDPGATEEEINEWAGMV